MPYQVVLDTDVLVAAARSKTGASFELLRLFGLGDHRWEWNISTAMLIPVPGRTHFANRCEAGVHAGTEVGGVLLELVNKFFGGSF